MEWLRGLKFGDPCSKARSRCSAMSDPAENKTLQNHRFSLESCFLYETCCQSHVGYASIDCKLHMSVVSENWDTFCSSWKSFLKRAVNIWYQARMSIRNFKPGGMRRLGALPMERFLLYFGDDRHQPSIPELGGWACVGYDGLYQTVADVPRDLL